MIRKPQTLATTVLVCLLFSTAVLGPVEAEQYVISTVAGEVPHPPPTPVPGVELEIRYPLRVAVDSQGNAYFTTDNYVFKLDQNGIATRIAGSPQAGYSGDGGPATSAQFSSPDGVAVDQAGNLFVADYGNHRVRKISPGGIIVTVAGDGTPSYSGDDGPAVSARMLGPRGVAVDQAGNLIIADSGNRRIRKVSPGGIMTTVAGRGTPGFSGDGGPAVSAELNAPTGVAVDGAGNLFIADTGNRRIREVSIDGTIATIAGDGTLGSTGDGGPATSAQLYPPNGVAVDGAGNLFISDSYFFDDGSDLGVYYSFIRKVSSSGIISTVTQVYQAGGVAVDGAGNLFIVDYYQVLKVSSSGIITTVAGPGNREAGDPSRQLHYPTGIAIDGSGNLFVADSQGYRVVKVSSSGILAAVPGITLLNEPAGLAVDAAGNLFVANHTVRKVSPGGTITTVGDEFGYGVALDGAGNLFIAAMSSVRKVSSSGIVTTVAGISGTQGESGDGGLATSAHVGEAIDVAVDGAGNLFMAEMYYNKVRKVSPDGIITTVAGNGTQGNNFVGYSGDGGPATSAQLSQPDGLAVDGAGNLFIADVYNNRIRLVTPDGKITTVAGNSTGSVLRGGVDVGGYSGDGGIGALAQLSQPTALAVDHAGNVYFTDSGNSLVRVLRPTKHFISAVVDAASERADSISPGKIVVLYGTGLGPAQLVKNQPVDGQFSTSVGGTAVSFNGIAAPILYASATQIAAVAPYAISGTTAQVIVTYQGEASAAFAVPVALSAPSLFTLNETGSGQATAMNADGTVNTAANPAKIADSITLFATGEGQTSPGGVDGKLEGSSPILPIKVTIGGVQTTSSAGGVPGQVAGLMQVKVQIPPGVQPGGYVPVVLQVGDASSTPGAVWIAVSSN